ncbi:unnamed protein product [Symbiodinium pilosum]|uniref:PDZ domain-containing protein n=1 Tax=Symbiodinium pilosum TaxID=2952 RepID=A0A812LHJ3_SYMPI|nr:unnamed protein product [Symbiodinium pilosum]
MFHVLLHVPGGRRSFLRRGALLVAAALALSYATFAFVPRIVKALANQCFLTRVVRQAAKERNPVERMQRFLRPRMGKGTIRELPPNAEMIGSLKIAYEVVLPKPMGIALEDGPQGPGFGVGVADVMEGGSAHKLLQDVLAGRKDSMWIQEGDELEAVNGEPLNGFKEKATELVQKSGDEPVRLTLSRPRKGYIKVVFPDGKSATSPRAAILKRLAEKVGYNCGCTCSDGRCGKCFHKDPATGEVYVLPLNVPGLVPSVWRRSDEGGVRPGEAEFECWIPLRLERAPEEYEKAIKEEAAESARRDS